MMRLISFIFISTLSIANCHHNKKHCADVKPLALPAKPFAGRWYAYATTSCTDSHSVKHRLGLFNNNPKTCKCEVIDFYSNGKSYELNTPTHFIDYAYNDGTKAWDQTVFDYYTLNSTYSESTLGVYVAESSTYYDDVKIHPGSSGSSSSSEEKKTAAGKQKFFFTCLDNEEEYKIFYVCTKFHHLSQGKPVVWVLTRSATPTTVTIEKIKTCFTRNNITTYESLTFVSHSNCAYSQPQAKYGNYAYN